ncbi:hypothetical protein [Methylobacterium aerolatum]|nr:hypothetical protein [Methylobacterium aerolatum]GJD34529.1 hypothetical protein FMGBMHLM_1431 [Methylobacterium aerolatum]
MEHFKSTIATTAIAAFGLVAAAHILHPGNFERTTYPSRPAATVVQQASAWVDPPAAAEASTTLPETKPVIEARDTLPVAWTSGTAQSPEKAVEAKPAKSRRKVSSARRHRVAQRQAHQRDAALARPTPATSATAPVAQAQERRPSPLTDLIHGLGLGSDS